MTSNDVSLLSDELKPRKTPEPATFGEFSLRPSVPDLSIIEGSHAVSFPTSVGNDKTRGSINSPSYNEWKRRTSPSGERFMTSTDSNFVESRDHPSMVHGPVNSTTRNKRVVLDCISSNSQKFGLSDSAPCIGKAPSYSDFKRRPTSAPVVTYNFPASNQSTHRSSLLMENGRDRLPPHQYSTGGTIQQRQNVKCLRSSPMEQTRDCVSTMLLKQSSTKEAGIERTGGPDRYSPIKPVSSLTETQYVNNHNPNMIQHHSCPTGAFGPLDGHFNLQPCHHNQSCLSCLHAYNRDQGCSLGTCHSGSVKTAATKSSLTNPSYDELYRIVLAQNNELKTLQGQVEKLLRCQEQNKSAQPEPACVIPSHAASSRPEPLHVGMVREEGTQTSDSEGRTVNSQKMSIGVMTSFIHAVAYSGRIGLKDIHEDNYRHSHRNNSRSHTHSDSAGSEISSDCVSDDSSEEAKKRGVSRPCKDCHSKRVSQKKVSMENDKQSQLDAGERSPPEGKTLKPYLALQSSASISSQHGSGNNPGVSAAINAVRGCQAVLASNTGAHLDKSLTFNAANLPTVPEQPVSPLSSIHVDLQDYRDSSTEETGYSESDGDCSPLKQETHHTADEKKPHGWTFYNKVLGQVNQILTENGNAQISSSGCLKNSQNPSKIMGQKSSSASRKGRVAFQAHKESEKAENLKALALRYLRENHPEELASNCSPLGGSLQKGENVQEMTVYNVPASNMSFATFRYLERYNLLPENFNPEQYLEAAVNVCGFNRKTMTNPLVQDSTNRPLPEPRHRNHRTGNSKSRQKSHQCISHENHRRSPRKVYKMSKNYDMQHQHVNAPPSKILDITALQQQPKLL